MSLTHASFFSGVGGLDLGMERAGWRTVSFSEIDPYACAVLAERWPSVPNLGSILNVGDVPDAALWSGGFPCQDLSVAGKRAGFGGERSSLAFTFLGLVERYRPPAVLLENVPGLLSSHGGRDMARLLGEMVELGYGVAYRVLDARHFGVPQRRRRVFILGLRSAPDDVDGHLAAERAAAVLAVGTRCGRHPATGGKAGPGAADGPRTGLEIAGGLTKRYGKGVNTTIDDGALVLPGSSPDARGDGAADGLAGRAYDRGELAHAVSASQGHHGHSSPRGDGSDNLVFVKGKRAQTAQDDESWRIGDVSPTVNGFDTGDTRATAQVADGGQVTSLSKSFGMGGPDAAHAQAGWLLPAGAAGPDDPLLPLGLDSHRYRCCGNGVVAPVAEWIGRRLVGALA